MAKKYTVLPCNGLDKCAGCLAGEVAKQLAEATGSPIICPVLYRVADAPYARMASENFLLVIDGCATRCASKLAAEKHLPIAAKITITEEAKAAGITLSDSLRLGGSERRLAKELVKKLSAEKITAGTTSVFSFPERLEYAAYRKDKFTFRLPKDTAFYFNENDCWAYVSGSTARIGITDYAQKSLSDIIFFTPPALGTSLQQFGAAGEIESAKAIFEVVSPVSGKITAINEILAEWPELLNEDPYEKGWIAEIALYDFAADKELLYRFDQYFEIMKKKVDEFHV